VDFLIGLDKEDVIIPCAAVLTLNGESYAAFYNSFLVKGIFDSYFDVIGKVISSDFSILEDVSILKKLFEQDSVFFSFPYPVPVFANENGTVYFTNVCLFKNGGIIYALCREKSGSIYLFSCSSSFDFNKEVERTYNNNISFFALNEEFSFEDFYLNRISCSSEKAKLFSLSRSVCDFSFPDLKLRLSSKISDNIKDEEGFSSLRSKLYEAARSVVFYIKYEYLKTQADIAFTDFYENNGKYYFLFDYYFDGVRILQDKNAVTLVFDEISLIDARVNAISCSKTEKYDEFDASDVFWCLYVLKDNMFIPFFISV